MGRLQRAEVYRRSSSGRIHLIKLKTISHDMPVICVQFHVTFLIEEALIGARSEQVMYALANVASKETRNKISFFFVSTPLK